MLLFDVGLGWVGSVKSWVGLGWVTENGPTSMSGVNQITWQPGRSCSSRRPFRTVYNHRSLLRCTSTCRPVPAMTSSSRRQWQPTGSAVTSRGHLAGGHCVWRTWHLSDSHSETHIDTTVSDSASFYRHKCNIGRRGGLQQESHILHLF